MRNSNVPLPEPARLSPGEPARRGLRAGRATRSDAGNAYRQSHHRQTHYQSPWLPADPDVMSAIITYMVTFDCLPDVDEWAVR
ncbi:hypothetical protein ACVXHB_08395 [Escherichia coli]